MRSRAVSVGVPHTAADGCNAATSLKISTFDAASFMTPVTSVARCITFGRCNTNGASGTLVEEANGSSASATERTAYSCSSKSLEDFAREPASAKSRSSSPVRRIVPANTLEVTKDLLNLTSSSGVAPTKLSTKNSQVDGYSVSRV